MQYHLSGFRPGDPSEHPKARSLAGGDGDLDVLIIGCGPAGLTLATYLAQFPHIRTRIVEQKDGLLRFGQADGIACRTMEMFQAFGFAHHVVREAYWVNETTFWQPAPENRDHIARSGRIQDTEDGLSEFPHVILSQARVHDFYLDMMRKAPTRLKPDYGTRFVTLEVPAAENAPVSVTLESANGTSEIVKARFVVGCDGARSGVRRALGVELRGDSANAAWGVMDVLAVTDFPDIRLKTAIQSQSGGSLLIIPREGGYLVRLYIELDKLGSNERVADRGIVPDHLIATARRILHPYTLDVKEIAWWSVYEIGQRLSDSFSNVSPGTDRTPRVFITGDACHTHSPKAGQGMNVSMADAFNLGWKLQTVIEGRAGRELLQSYSDERQAIARELINFDREFATMFSSGRDTADPVRFQAYFQKQGRYTAGVATRYAPSLICGPDTWQERAAGFEIGSRFHSAPVIRWADARPLQLGHTIAADGRWRLMVFADPGSRAALDLVRQVAQAPDALARRFNSEGTDTDAILDLRVILQEPHRDVVMKPDMPELFPEKGPFGLRDYEKLFCADPRADIFDKRRINRKTGALVVVRPDQYVAHILPLEAQDELASFFAAIFNV